MQGTVNPLGPRTRAERDAISAAAIAGVAGFALGLVLLWGRLRPIAGEDSVGTTAAMCAGLAAAISFAAPYALTTDPLALARSRRAGRVVRAVAGLAVTAACLGLGYTAAETTALVFQAGFVGLELDPLGGAIACALAAAAAAYLARPLGQGIDTRTLATLVPTFLVVGVISSMLTASDPQWWQRHFSELGADGGVSGATFNVTLVVSGLLVAAMGAYVARDLERTTRPGSPIGWVGGLLAIIGILMLLVGLVRVDVAEWLHIVFASGMVVVFFVLCGLTPRLAPGLPRQIHVVSAVVIGAIVVALLLWVPVGYYNFTAFELAACGLIFVWLTAFVRTVAAASEDAASGAPTGHTTHAHTTHD